MNQAHAPNPTLGLPWWLAYERFIGIDIHKHYVTVVALDQPRQVLWQRRRIPLEQWPAWVEQHLTAQDAVIMEATTNCWWVYDQTAPVAGRCVVAHPDTKARVKTAPRDSLMVVKGGTLKLWCDRSQIAGRGGFQTAPVAKMAQAQVSSLREAATRASFLALPRPTRRS
jgi:hypothetical protein